MLAYFRPLFEMGLLLLGEWWFHVRFKEDRSKFNRYIIQITSVGREVERVNEIINEIRSYPMSMNYQIWVVIEPGHQHRLPERGPRHRRAEGVHRQVEVQVPGARIQPDLAHRSSAGPATTRRSPSWTTTPRRPGSSSRPPTRATTTSARA